MYSVSEYHDMLFIYGQTHCTSNEARRIYKLSFPEKYLPSFKTFVAIYQQLLDTGSVFLKCDNRGW